MIISRIYNNNVVATTDEFGQEMIVIGRGVAFGKKSGDTVDESMIEKQFVFSDPTVNRRLEVILKNMDNAEVYLQISEEILEMLRAESNTEIGDSLLLTLTDHIATSIERERKGIVLENLLLSDIRHLYHAQFQLAQKVANIIKMHTGVTVSQDEIGFITLHIVNATVGGGFDDLFLNTRLMQEIISIVQEYFQIILNEKSLRYERFIRHLQFFIRRILDPAGEQETNLLMYNMGRREFPEAFICVKKIADHVEKNYHRTVTDAEQGYLIYHIMNVIIETKERKK